MTELIEGAEAWSSYSPGSSADTGVLVLHGFTGNPVSLRPLAEALAAEGFAVELPLLPGHGTTWKHMQRTTWRDWSGEAAAALDRLRAVTRSRVAVGLSMGGTLAVHLAETRGADLAGIALVNPSVHSADTRLRAVPVAKYLVPSASSIGNDIARPDGDERAYPRVPLRALASLLQFQRRVRADLGRVSIPTLVFTSRADHVVDPSNSTLVLEGIAAADAEQMWLERSYHVATLDYDAELIAERTAAFVRRVTGTPAR